MVLTVKPLPNDSDSNKKGTGHALLPKTVMSSGYFWDNYGKFQSCKPCAGDDFCKNAKLAPGADFAIVVSVWNQVSVSISVSHGSVCAVCHRDA